MTTTTATPENDMAKMTFPVPSEPDPVEKALRGTYSDHLAVTLAEASGRLARASELLSTLAVEARSLTGADADVEALVRRALQAVQREAPDLAGVAHAAEQYRLQVDGYLAMRGPVPAAAVPEGDEPKPCDGGAFDHECPVEPAAGTRFCWEHLIAQAKRYGMGNHFPIGSPEPTEANVPAGQHLVGENGVHWSRTSSGDWIAGGPIGDGRRHPWHVVNGDRESGMALVRLHPGMVSE